MCLKDAVRRTFGKEGSLEFDDVGVVIEHLEVLDLPDGSEWKLFAKRGTR
jgi:hypothetical protein